MEKINITKEAAFRLIKHYLTNCINADITMDVISANLPASALELLMEILAMDYKYVPILENNHVKIVPSGYHKGRNFNEDILMEMGLYEDGYVFAKVIGDGGWSSEFNKYSGKLKISYYYHDSDKKLKLTEDTVSVLEAIKINKSDIPYFKFQEHVENITPTVNAGDDNVDGAELTI